MVRRRDWRALIQLRRDLLPAREARRRRSARTNLHIYAGMRGESLEDFQKTRNERRCCTPWPARKNPRTRAPRPNVVRKHGDRTRNLVRSKTMPTISDVSIINWNKAEARRVESGLERTICSKSLCGSKT